MINVSRFWMLRIIGVATFQLSSGQQKLVTAILWEIREVSWSLGLVNSYDNLNRLKIYEISWTLSTLFTQLLEVRIRRRLSAHNYIKLFPSLLAICGALAETVWEVCSKGAGFPKASLQGADSHIRTECCGFLVCFVWCASHWREWG